MVYDAIEQHVMKARVLAAKEGQADYDQQGEIGEAYAAYVLLWKRLEHLQPGAVEGPGDKGVRE